MFHSQIIGVTFATILSVLSVNAQSNPITSCQALTGMDNVNLTLIAGQWYEEFRAPALNISCVQLNITVVNATQFNVTTMYSASKNGYLMNKIDKAVVNASSDSSTNGFVAKYTNSNVIKNFKVLSTDYNSSAVICGYTNASDSFAFILTRQQIVNSTWLMQLQNNASQILSTFNDTSAVNITQSKLCKANSAATSIPAIATLFAAFYALVKISY